MSDQITILCKRTVVSTKPVQPGKFHHLSALDQVMEPNRQIRMVYYYTTPPGWAVGAVTKKLRESISEMLNGFPMVTGRLLKNDEGQWMIKCNDAGVRLVEARVKGRVEGWLRRADREKELLLVHWEDMHYKPYFWSTFYVQVWTRVSAWECLGDQNELSEATFVIGEAVKKMENQRILDLIERLEGEWEPQVLNNLHVGDNSQIQCCHRWANDVAGDWANDVAGDYAGDVADDRAPSGSDNVSLTG
ncbi:hypothetical protein RHSIM_Rhsim02G0190300 [Rhododendron simsii]|uniref:Uncharacterized protein n=1 Tax=Rhododendron simsii TaxID=118357 RepID=A0A834LWB0_RHOSS|nr:hypothetical protein RHSIM_Rhsim02G0190300 [Rhododendron simsii]